jgi:hypothetical protein
VRSEAAAIGRLQIFNFLPLNGGGATMRIKASGINIARARLASGEIKTYYYHRATGARLVGTPGSPEFLVALAAAEKFTQDHHAGTLSSLIRDFEKTK